MEAGTAQFFAVEETRDMPAETAEAPPATAGTPEPA